MFHDDAPLIPFDFPDPEDRPDCPQCGCDRNIFLGRWTQSRDAYRCVGCGWTFLAVRETPGEPV